jgi:hypothetical protein
MLSTENYCYGKTAAMDLTREAFTSPVACVMLEPAAAHDPSVLIDLIEAAVGPGSPFVIWLTVLLRPLDDAAKILGPAGRQPGNLSPRFTKFQVHPSVPDLVASDAGQGGSL